MEKRLRIAIQKSLGPGEKYFEFITRDGWLVALNDTTTGAGGFTDVSIDRVTADLNRMLKTLKEQQSIKKP